MLGQMHLHEPASVKEAKRVTVPGMASWAGEGPAGTTCRECQEWKPPERNAYFAASHDRGPTLKPTRCDKACRMMNHSMLPKIEHDQPTCKYFVRNPTPPVILKEKKTADVAA